MRIIEINDKVYRVEEAKTEQEQIEGLSDVAEMPEDVGMLFYFDPPQEIGMWMKDTIIPLDIIFFNEDQEVIKVAEGIPNDETLISANDVAYVLEVNRNSGIEVGDEFEFTDESDDEEDTEPVMKVLAQDGSTQMELWGGERIISRRETKVIINKSKKIMEAKDDETKYNNRCKNLGRYVFKVFKGQDDRPAEYVNQPKD